MFLSRNKKNNVYPCKPQFDCIKVGFKGVKIIKVRFRDATVYHLLGSLTFPAKCCKLILMRFRTNVYLPKLILSKVSVFIIIILITFG